jgi:hypothetical protein
MGAGSLRRLQTEDPDFRVFGASKHQYKLRPILTEDELQEFGQRHQITLPEEYRLFLKEVGNGGAGHGYGLYPLSNTTENSQPGIPFSLASLTPLSDGWKSMPLIDDERAPDERAPGVLEIETQGCAHATYLVVNGDTYGTIWKCWSINEVYPTGLTFSAWYQQWISRLEEKALPILAREQEARQIKVGMTKQEATDVFGGECHVREIIEAGRRLLGFDGLSTEFELSENDVITERREWTIIVQ